MTRHESRVAARQDPLRARYADDPTDAHIIDAARSRDGLSRDPWHGQVVPGDHDYGVAWSVGMHRAVGGYHDQPNPGDMLCAAFAVCLDSTIRMIADRWNMPLTALEVAVEGDVDVRGTLMVDQSVQVGFQRMRCTVAVDAAPGTPRVKVEKLVAAAEHCCVNLQTLRAGVPVETRLVSPSATPQSPPRERVSRAGSAR